MRWLRRIAIAAGALYLAAAAAVAGFIQFYPQPQALPEGAIIVVLSAGQNGDGSMGRNTAERLSAGIDLFWRLNARRMVVTGGAVAHETRPVAQSMAAAARAAGVPEDRLTVEPRALSTLQNALFTADLLGEERNAPLVLVSQRFHLPRVWASFRWAGMSELTLYPADSAIEHWRRFGARTVLLEAAKALGNLARASAVSIADLLGVQPATYMPLLD